MNTINDSRLAYIAGVFMGDGCIDDRGRCASTTIVMEDRDVLEQVAAFHSEITSHHCHPRPLRKRPHLCRLRLTDTRLSRELVARTNGKTTLPSLGNPQAKKDFIAGLMDTDGHISQNTTTNGQTAKRWLRFGLGFVNSGPWLGTFLELLQEFAVQTGKPVLKRKYRSADEKDCWQVCIGLRSFADAGLFFRCQRKQNVLLAYVEHMRKS